MSYKNDSEIVILNRYGKASSEAKAQMFETFDRLRDLTVSGPAMGGSGMGKFSSMFMNIARMLGSASFNPSFGSEAMNIPGTSFFSPITGGTGILPGGQAAFGLAPMASSMGFPAAGGAAPIGGVFAGGAAPLSGNGGPLAMLGAMGVGSDWSSSLGVNGIGGVIAGGAGSIGDIATAGGLAAGTAAGAGFGRNWAMPAAGIMSGIGGILTTLGPFFGPFGIAGAAAGSIMNGAAGAVLQSFQHVSNRILVNADTILTNKIKNLETTVKQLDAQQDIVKKLLKESVDGDKKALDSL
ncbi:MAG: hypothetical protein IPK79_06370 [Vampirovibrionales bacterium]|nr:hypothetical protein [Vampirovibrionales bacterium]